MVVVFGRKISYPLPKEKSDEMIIPSSSEERGGIYGMSGRRIRIRSRGAATAGILIGCFLMSDLILDLPTMKDRALRHSRPKNLATAPVFMKRLSNITRRGSRIDRDGNGDDDGDDDGDGDGKISADGIRTEEESATSSVSEFCRPPLEDPLPYEKCSNRTLVYRYGVYGGMTNALNFILKGTMRAFEEDVCFYVDETGPMKYAPMAAREAPEVTLSPFLNRYFEPMGLPPDHEIVAGAGSRVAPPYHEIADKEILDLMNIYRYRKRFVRTIESLGYVDMDITEAKKRTLRRFWRLLPKVREEVCHRLARYGLEEDGHIAFSVRRGDKQVEFEGLSESITAEQYVDAAEAAVESHFDGKVPTIFVATDDCSVMDELRLLRSEWTFVSQCDGGERESGFFLSDMVHWTPEQTDRHYTKFFAELIGMASARYFVGVSITNVAMWVYYMRGYDKKDDSWELINYPDHFVLGWGGNHVSKG